MRKFIVFLLIFSLSFWSVACTPQNVPNDTLPANDLQSAESVETSTAVDGEATYEMPDFSDVSLDDEVFMDYLEYDLSTTLEEDEHIIVESIEPIYISQEYIDELAYNSLENVYYGYKLSELDAQFGDIQYAFTVGNGQTVAVPISTEDPDEVLNTVIRNTAIGAGVIVLCVTFSVVTGGGGAPVAVGAAHAIFTYAAIGAASGATIGAASGGVFSGAQKIGEYLASDEDVNWNEVGESAAVGASEGFKWGAIIGAATGAVSGAVQISAAAKNVGTYGDVVKANAGNLSKAGEEVHHVIPDAVSGTTRSEGLAIKMAKGDHRLLTSTGSSREAQAFHAEIRGLLDAGKTKEAYTMAFNDILSKTGNKYLAEITRAKELTGLF
ncbi:MAG: hypothetical protein LBL54_01770 [Clostridiales Family XIII bacterium]|jgi:hypothetical protein|nr:hypothetical protein [Clostridiales Family XIII bacterium]